MDPPSKHVNDVTQLGRRAACIRSRNEGQDATDGGDMGGRSVSKSMNIQCRKRNTKLNAYFEYEYMSAVKLYPNKPTKIDKTNGK
jgi:hypothetical protein